VLLRASEGTLSRWSWLHLQSLAPTNPHWAVVGFGPFSLCVIHKEGQSPSCGYINRLMMMMMMLINVIEFFIHTLNPGLFNQTKKHFVTYLNFMNYPQLI
jgi:hypothetical protein